MGVREIGRCLEQWQMEVKDLRRRMILAPTPWERERWYAHAAAGPGLDGSCHGGGSGKGSSHYWPLGVGPLGGRACSPDI